MPHGVHNTRQTAFRIPERLLAPARAGAEKEGISLTAWVIDAIERKLGLRRPGEDSKEREQ